MSITIEKVLVEGAAVNLKSGRASLRFAKYAFEKLNVDVRNKLSLLVRSESDVFLKVVEESGEIMLDLDLCKLSAAIVKVGTREGVLTFATENLSEIWAEKKSLGSYLRSEYAAVTLVISVAQPDLFNGM